MKRLLPSTAHWTASLVLAATLLVSIVLPARVASADASTAADARARAQKLLGKDADGYQTKLPEEAQAKAPSSDAPLKPHEPRRRADEVEVGSAGSPVASAFMWVILGVAVVLLVTFVVREFGDYGENVASPVLGTDEGGESAAATALVVERPLDDAEALARDGRFGEAIHALLLRTLEELMRRLDRPLPRSRTSREILHEVRLPDEARGALSHLVSAVEVSFFGGAEPGAEDYQVCVDRFRRFADAYTRGVRA